MAVPTRPVVVLTREPEDNQKLAKALVQREVPVLEIPCVATRFIEPGGLPSGCQAVVFTSRRGVQGLFRHGQASPLPAGKPAPLVCAVGDATARALMEVGIKPDLTADPPQGEVLAKLLMEKLETPSRIVLVGGNLTTGNMEKMFAAAGFGLKKIVVYENFRPDIPVVSPIPVAAVFVASPSAGRRLIGINPWLRACPFVAIGDTTAASLADLGVASVRNAGPDPGAWIDLLWAAYQAALQNMPRVHD